MKTKLHAIILILLFTIAYCHAQEIKGSHWVIIKKDSSSISIKDMQTVLNDNLLLTTKNSTTRIPVDSIILITRIRKGAVGHGIIGGAIAGFGVGAILGVAAGNGTPYLNTGDVAAGAVELGFFGSILGTLVGGIVGLGNSKDKIYDLSKMALLEKSNLIESKCRR